MALFRSQTLKMSASPSRGTQDRFIKVQDSREDQRSGRPSTHPAEDQETIKLTNVPFEGRRQPKYVDVHDVDLTPDADLGRTALRVAHDVLCEVDTDAKNLVSTPCRTVPHRLAEELVAEWVQGRRWNYAGVANDFWSVSIKGESSSIKRVV